VYECYGLTISILWISLEYGYLLLLQVAAFVLALATCRVKIEVLNDSKEMMAIVYTTTAIVTVLGIFTFIRPTYMVLSEAVFSLGTMLATSLFLGLLFIPKVKARTSTYLQWCCIHPSSDKKNAELSIYARVCGY